MSSISTFENPIEVFTDGSHIKGTDKLGFGVWCEVNGQEYALSGVSTPEFLRSEFGITEPTVSNPTMEMLALVKALEQFAQTGEHLIIYADYQGVQCWMNGSWKRKKPYIKTLGAAGDKLIAEIKRNGGSVRLEWVKGHSGVHGNEMADEAATDRAEYNTIPQLFEASG